MKPAHGAEKATAMPAAPPRPEGCWRPLSVWPHRASTNGPRCLRRAGRMAPLCPERVRPPCSMRQARNFAAMTRSQMFRGTCSLPWHSVQPGGFPRRKSAERPVPCGPRRRRVPREPLPTEESRRVRTVPAVPARRAQTWRGTASSPQRKAPTRQAALRPTIPPLREDERPAQKMKNRVNVTRAHDFLLIPRNA